MAQQALTVTNSTSIKNETGTRVVYLGID